MSPTGAVVVFVCAWWLFFFMALPFGVSPEAEPEAGHDPGAPAKPRLWLKALVATVLAALATWFAAEIIASGAVSLRGKAAPF